MKTLTQDQFAIFIAKEIREIEQYNFDVLYDISTIMQDYYLVQQKQNFSTPEQRVYYLFLRRQGSWLNVESQDKSIYTFKKENSDKVYKLTFCFNHKYLTDKAFCTVEQIKGGEI